MLTGMIQSFYEAKEGKNEQAIYYQDMGPKENQVDPKEDLSMG
jgi:hypothetical protein